MATSASNSPERVEPGRVRLRTQTGSIYEIDFDERTWSRTPTLASGIIRTESGQVTSIQIPGIGQPAVILGPPIDPDSDVRVITTSAVMAIEPIG